MPHLHGFLLVLSILHGFVLSTLHGFLIVVGSIPYAIFLVVICILHEISLRLQILNEIKFKLQFLFRNGLACDTNSFAFGS